MLKKSASFVFKTREA